MRHTRFLAAAVLLAGCGGPVAMHERPAGQRLSSDGMSIDLPEGWSGRIVLGSAGRPVLHAANYLLPASDTDAGQIAQETIGSSGMVYVNVRDEGVGEADGSLPVELTPSDFRPPSGADSRCCFITVASREIAAAGHRYGVRVVSGSDDKPAPRTVELANFVLSTLALGRYEPGRVEPAIGNSVRDYGMGVTLPDGWEGGVGRGVVEASNSSLELTIREHQAPDQQSFVNGRAPIELGPAEFVPAQGLPGFETGRSFVEHGRDFVLSVRAREDPPDPTSLAQANSLLATFRAEPGDFYPGTVEPATFAPADGWHTGTSGPAEVQPDGQQTSSWAATVSYRDSAFQFPPHDTLDALPADGVLVMALLARYGPKEAAPAGSPPFRLEDFMEGSFEGVQPASAPRVLRVHFRGYDLALWAFFGREHPTQQQLDRAQAELDRLRLPDWTLSS